MKTKTHFAFRVDVWDDTGSGIVEHCRRRCRSHAESERATIGIESEWTPDMKCPGCGAEMNLIEVAPDKTEMAPGYEQCTFECSSCHDHVRQLVFVPRAIEPLNSEETRLSAAWLETLSKGTRPKGDDSPRAVRAASSIKAMSVVGMLMIALAGSMIIWGQSSKGPMGDPGPPGPKGLPGDAGPPSTTSGIRIVRSNCDETACRVQCDENEMLLTAYCGPKRNSAIIPTERAATCRNPMPVNSPLVAVCALMLPP